MSELVKGHEEPKADPINKEQPYLEEFISEMKKFWDQNTEITEYLQGILNRFTGDDSTEFSNLSQELDDSKGYREKLSAILIFMEKRNETLENIVNELKSHV